MHIIEVAEPLIETKIVWAKKGKNNITRKYSCLLYTSPSPRDRG